MLNYLIADLNRMSRKKSLIYTLATFLGLFLTMVFIIYTPNLDGGGYLSKTDLFLGFYPLVVGIPIFLSIYSDDFKSKAMQIAIGYGIDRNKIILTKAIETVILSVISGVLLGVLVTVVPKILGLTLTHEQFLELTLGALTGILKIIVYVGISTILVYHYQNAMYGTISFVLLGSGTVGMILNLILSQQFVVDLVGNLTEHMFTTLLAMEKLNYMTKGSFNITSIIEIILYMVIPVIVSMIIFRKKELEF